MKTLGLGVRRLWLACGLVCWTAAPAVAETPRHAGSGGRTFQGTIVGEDVRPHIEHLAGEKLRGRAGADALEAARYIRDHLQRWKLQPLFGEEFFQEIPGNAATAPGAVLGRNVGAILPGGDPRLRDEVIIVSAHFDHLGVRGGQIYAGADDNASGVAMLLATARAFAAAPQPPRRSIAFVGFDLEEHLLWGSRWFVAHPPRPLEQVKLFITADMIGRSLGNLPLPTVFVLGSEHAPQVKRTLDQVGTPHGLEAARLGIDLIGTRSDYGPFRDQKVPFLFFSTGEHPDYHTPGDVAERIDYDKAARVSSLVLEVARAVADADAAPEWSDEVQPDLDEARAVHRITTLLLEQTDRPLTEVQSLLVSHVRSKSGQILEKGEMSAADRKWLARYAQLLLLSVF